MFSGHIIHPMFSTLIAILSNISGNTLICFTPTKGSPGVNIHMYLVICCCVGSMGTRTMSKSTSNKDQGPSGPTFFSIIYIPEGSRCTGDPHPSLPHRGEVAVAVSTPLGRRNAMPWDRYLQGFTIFKAT